MFTERKMFRLLAVLATLALYALTTQNAVARGGGHGGGGHHGGGHHGGHHASHNHHHYHPSHHHASHHHHSSHHDHHHGDHHYAHHHHGWHHGGWGPGFWGGAAAGYGLGYGYGNWNGWGDGGDGDTYVDNSTNVTPASNETANDDSDGTAEYGDDENGTADQTGDEGFPTDNWPELGVVTYAGEYGGSQGQVVMDVVPGSAADKAGLVPGDVILTFNGKPVPSADDLDSAMDSAGGKFEASVWDARTGRKSDLNGTLDPAAVPPPASETAAAPPAQQ